MTSGKVFVLGSFAVDASFRSPRLPGPGETVAGHSFALGPGGKGSNQAVAAARFGASVTLLTAVGDDSFAAIGRQLWREERIHTAYVRQMDQPTGAACILVNETTGENAIVIAPGACLHLVPADVDHAAEAIRSSDVFLAQLEVPLEVVARGLKIARSAGVRTILNPAPAPLEPLPRNLLANVDFLIPNETEAQVLTGLPTDTESEAQTAAERLLSMGSSAVLLTRGEAGSLLLQQGQPLIKFAARSSGPVVDTAGAGDVFCGAFSAALAAGKTLEQAGKVASAAAGIAVTRAGTARSAPHRTELDSFMQEFRPNDGDLRTP